MAIGELDAAIGELEAAVGELEAAPPSVRRMAGAREGRGRRGTPTAIMATFAKNIIDRAICGREMRKPQTWKQVRRDNVMASDDNNSSRHGLNHNGHQLEPNIVKNNAR